MHVPSEPTVRFQLANPTRSDLKRTYITEEAIVTSLAGQDEAHTRAAARAEESQRTAEEAREALLSIRATETSLSEQVARLESRQLRARLFPRRTATAVARLRDDLSVVADGALTAKSETARARDEAADAASVEAQLRADAEELARAEQARRRILEALFGGQDVGSPEENEIEGRRDRLVGATSRGKRTYLQQRAVLTNLQGAMSELLAARKALFNAQLTNTVDIFSSGSLGVVAGLSSQANLRSAGKLVKAAEIRMRKAVEANPNLPIAKAAHVHNGFLLGFADIFFDNIFTDLIIRSAIERAVRSVDKALLSVRENLLFQKEHVHMIRNELRDSALELKRTSEDLVRVRADLLHEEV